jgi:hypothetical protein
MANRPKTMAAAMKKVESSAADRSLDRRAGVKEGSAKDIRADKMQARNLMAGKPQVNGGVKAAYGMKKMAEGGMTGPRGVQNAMQRVAKSGSARATEALSATKKMAKGGTMKRPTVKAKK